MSFCKCELCELPSHEDSFCASLTRSQLQELIQRSSPMELSRKTTLDDALVEKWPVIAVIDGVIGMQHTLHDGRRTIAAYYTKGDIVDLREPLTHMQGNLVSLTKARVCCLHPKSFQSILENNAKAWTAVSQNQRAQHQLTIRHVADLGKKTALEKLASFLLECHLRGGSEGSSASRGGHVNGATHSNGENRVNDARSMEIALPMPRVSLADYMGMQPETVSRELRRLKEMKLIKISAENRIIVQDAVRLKRLANGRDCQEFSKAAEMAVLAG